MQLLVVAISFTLVYNLFKEMIIMENRGLKTRTAFSNAIDSNLCDQLKRLSKQTRIPQSKLLDEAISDLLRKYKSKN